MARPLRIEYPGALYHITARGNARQGIYQDDQDRQRFLDLLCREAAPQAVLERSTRAAFQATVYLLRRAANLSLREVREVAGISPSRISQIQRLIETEGADTRLAELIANCKKKN
jgi:hypothetical protein